jgi:hypothetical protein
MSLEDLGNIGEFVAAVGVVLSLIYLAVQIRQNTSQLIEGNRAQRLAAQRDTVAAFSRYRHLVVLNPDVSRLLQKGALDLESLTEEERIRFDLLAYEQLFASETLFTHVEESLLPVERWDGVSQYLVASLSQPGLRQHWELNKYLCSSRFAAAVDKLLNERTAYPRSSEEST